MFMLEKMGLFNILFATTLCTFVSCQTNKSRNSVAHIDSLVSYNTETKINMYEDIWKKDSCGCLKMRTAQMADSIITNNHLIGKDTLAFIAHMGKYNKKENNQEGFILIYYINSTCLDGAIDDNADESWIRFSFTNDGKLKNIPEEIVIE